MKYFWLISLLVLPSVITLFNNGKHKSILYHIFALNKKKLHKYYYDVAEMMVFKVIRLMSGIILILVYSFHYSMLKVIKYSTLSRQQYFSNGKSFFSFKLDSI